MPYANDPTMDGLPFPEIECKDVWGNNGIEACWDAATMQDRDIVALSRGEPVPCTGMLYQFRAALTDSITGNVLDSPGQQLYFGAKDGLRYQSVGRPIVEGVLRRKGDRGRKQGKGRVRTFATWIMPLYRNAVQRIEFKDPSVDIAAATLRRLNIAHTHMDAARTLIFDTLCTHPDDQKQGYGKKTFQKLLPHFHRWGYETVLLYRHGFIAVSVEGKPPMLPCVRPSGHNDVSGNLFRKLGFHDHRQIQSECISHRFINLDAGLKSFTIQSYEQWMAARISNLLEVDRYSKKHQRARDR